MADELARLDAGTELLAGGTELATLDGLDEVVPPVQAAPFTLGRSTAPPLVTPWKPNSTV